MTTTPHADLTLRPLILGVLALASAGCAAGPAGGDRDPLSLPACETAVVAVAESDVQEHSLEALQGLVRELEWFPLDASPALVPVPARPRLQNTRELARAMTELFPSDLRERRVGGTVRFHVLLDEEGRVARSRLALGARYPAFNAAGARALERMVFDPVVHGGCRLPVFIPDLPLTFEVAE